MITVSFRDMGIYRLVTLYYSPWSVGLISHAKLGAASSWAFRRSCSRLAMLTVSSLTFDLFITVYQALDFITLLAGNVFVTF